MPLTEIPKSVVQQTSKIGLPSLARLPKMGADVNTIPSSEAMPFFSEFDLSVPRDLTTLNRLIEYYTKYHPIVGNSIDLHTQIAWSDFAMQCSDESIQRDYEDMVDDLDMKPLLYTVYHELFGFGESILLGDWNETDRIWAGFNGIPMSKLRVEHITDYTGKSQYIYYYSVSASDRRQVESYHSSYASPYNIDYVTYDAGENFLESYLNYGDLIPINDFYVFRVFQKMNSTDIRGTSMILRCLKYLLWEDYLIRAQLKIARDRINLPDIYLVGSETKPASDIELDTWRTLIEKQANDPSYVIVGAPPLDVRTYSNQIRLLQTEPYFRLIDEKIAIALWSDLGALTRFTSTYAGEAVKQGVRESRYNTIRSMVDNEIIKKVFMPVAIARGYTKRKTADIKHNVRTTPKGLDLPKLQRVEGKHYHYASRPDRGNLLPKIEYENNHNGVEKTFVLASTVKKFGANLTRRDLELPELIPVDRIRLQDVTEKVRALVSFAGNYPIPFSYICDLLGLDWGKMKEDLQDIMDSGKEEWMPPMVRPGTEGSPGGLGGDIPMMGGGGGGMPDMSLPSSGGGLTLPSPGGSRIPSPIPERPMGQELPEVTPPAGPTEI